MFVAIKNTYISSELKELDSDCEAVWASVQIAGDKKLITGSFYRPPDGNQTPIAELESSINNLPQADHLVLLGGDFNLPGVDWEREQTVPGSAHKQIGQDLLKVAADRSLSQVNNSTTRHSNILDLCFTSHPSLVKNTHVTPGISDHDILVVD